MSLTSSLPALPSPFPSPTKSRDKSEGFGALEDPFPSPTKSRDKSKGFGARESWSRRDNRNKTKRPCAASFGKGGPVPMHQFQNAGFVGRGVDWFGSKTDKVLRRSSVSPFTPRKVRSSAQVRVLDKTLQTLPPAEVSELRHSLNLPKDVMLQALDLFQKHAKSIKGNSSIKDRRLTEAGFANVWSEMTGQEYLPVECNAECNVPPKIVEEAFRHAPQSRELDFGQFAIWFSSRYFCEDVSLDKEGKELRSMARKHSLHHTKVENYKSMFNRFDKDRNGIIDGTEFEDLLCTCIKAPSSIGLPAARVKHLWRIADEDGDHEIDFEEFLTFYSKYLGMESTGFEDFYRFGGRRTLTT